MSITEVKNWKKLLRDEMDTRGLKEDDLKMLSSLCDTYFLENESVAREVSNQQEFIKSVKKVVSEIYQLRFNKNINSP